MYSGTASVGNYTGWQTEDEAPVRFLGVPRLSLGRRAASCWLWDASSACSSSLSCFSSGSGGMAMPGGSSPVARHAHSSSDSTVLDSRDRCFSVCCSKRLSVRLQSDTGSIPAATLLILHFLR